MAPAEAPKVVEEYIPDIIEERRKDSEGRTVTNQFVRGKLLGKVRSKVYLADWQLEKCPIVDTIEKSPIWASFCTYLGSNLSPVLLHAHRRGDLPNVSWVL